MDEIQYVLCFEDFISGLKKDLPIQDYSKAVETAKRIAASQNRKILVYGPLAVVEPDYSACAKVTTFPALPVVTA